MQRLGCITPLGLIAAIATVLIVAGAGLIGGGAMFSPGALSARADTGAVLGGVRSHAELGGNCAACHVDPWSSQVMATRCLDCHTDVRAQLADPQSLHSAMPGVMQCRGCHVEHQGEQASLTRIDQINFPHDRTGFALTAHQQQINGAPFQCGDCHGGSYARFDQTRCDTCHRDYQADFMARHTADFGSACLACHDGVDRFTNFDHNRLRFALTGEHAPLACGQCHVNARTAADLQAAQTDCAACHQKDDAHAGQFGTECGLCHTSSSWDDATFDHNLAAFKLEGRHQTVECGQCHVNGVFKGTPQTCIGCHGADDAHNGQFGADCAQCHTPSAWQDATFDHTLAAFQLTGAHVNVACAQCHINDVFKGTPQVCAACHAEPQVHLGAFGTDCAACHSTATWQGATFNHTFPLNHGESGNIACRTCHVTTDFKAYTCYGCHEHEPQRVQAKHLEEGIRDFQDCARCHPTGREKEGQRGDD